MSVHSFLLNSGQLPIPLQVSGIQGWFDADKISGVSDGGDVATWNDSSFNGRALTEATNRPTYHLNQYNGKPCVRFNGTSDILSSASFTTVAQPATQFLVAKVITADLTLNTTHYLTNCGGAQQSILVVDSLTNETFRISAGASITGPAKDTNLHVFVGLFNGASSNIRVDGGAGTGGNASTGGMSQFFLGARTGAAEFTNCDICEFIPYSGSLALADINKLGTYLAAKWGTTWTTAS